MRYIFIILLMPSCMSFISDDHVRSIDNELLPYYLDFIQDGKDRGVDLSSVPIILSLKDIKSNKGGHSYNMNMYNTVPKVEMNSNIWYDCSEYAKKYMVYHELGHALLNRTHEHENVSIMNTDVSGSIVKKYMTDEVYYIDELFQ